MGEMNAVHFLLFQQLCNIFQDGIPAWDPSTTYYTGSVVRKDGTAELYSSAIDNNTGNALPTQTNNGSWNYINTTSTVPPGAMSDFGGVAGNLPVGWLLCDGNSYPTATYPALFAAIGYTWGGAGANFNVPDMRGRASIGYGAGAGLTNRSVMGQLIGEESHILAVSEIPSGLTVTDPGHNHSQNPHGHSITDPGHTHVEKGVTGGVGSSNTISLSNSGTAQTNSTSSTVSAVTGITVANNTASNNAATTGISVGGGGAGHNNMQPSAVVLKIIKI
jgi:microcystin-dependent protein